MSVFRVSGSSRCAPLETATVLRLDRAGFG
jgi:hypothetical protein